MLLVGQAAGWRPNPDVVARATAQEKRDVNFDDAGVPPYTLPDVLGRGAGRAATRAAWAARRAEILELFRTNVYGRSPGRPEHLGFEVIRDDPRAMNGAATLRQVTITSRQAQRTHQFELTLFLPNRPGRVPVFLLINNRPASNTDPTREQKSGFWPAEDLIARGYGIAALQVNQLAPDNADTFRTGAMAIFDAGPGEPAPYSWGALAAWAWGASRAMDYLVTDARVDAARVAVVGHSRGGKAALWAGAEDERFAMVVSNDSGEGGAALSRRWFGETLEVINTAFPHWFTATYKTFNGRAAVLPVDQHMLLALIAPRALYVASADEDLWADQRGEFLSLAASSPAFTLHGEPAIADDEMPPLGTPLVRGQRGYHIRTGGHDLTPFDWARYADFGDRIWKK
ncbi:MAG: prolyl oligopeptidase family serine peptidase [Vicinamibacterales bacterium]